jgi:hypothetical protein
MKSEDSKSEDLETLRRLAAGNKPVTLLFAAKDSERNNAGGAEGMAVGSPARAPASKNISTKRRSGAQLRRARTIKQS